MKGAHHDPVDHSRTTMPHAGESFIDTLWLPGLWLIGLGVLTIAGMLASIAYQHDEWLLPLCLMSGALVTGGGLLVALEHHRVKRVEERWLAEHPERRTHLHTG
jgi:hypothetical protein